MRYSLWEVMVCTQAKPSLKTFELRQTQKQLVVCEVLMTMTQIANMHEHKIRKTRGDDVVWFPAHTADKYVAALLLFIMQLIVNN